MLRIIAVIVLLVLFVLGVGKDVFFPSLRMLLDTHVDPAAFLPLWSHKLKAVLWLVLLAYACRGWIRVISPIFFPRIKGPIRSLLAAAILLVLFSLYLWGLAVHGILVWPLVGLFFAPGLWDAWKAQRPISWNFRWIRWDFTGILILFLALLWTFEFMSSPVVWDAVLDHFRWAKEVARLQGFPLRWTNHTGDMPKAAELVWAGLWTLGGESLAKLGSALAALLTGWLLWIFAKEAGAKGSTILMIFLACPFFLAVFAWGYIEGFLVFFELLAFYGAWRTLERPGETLWFRVTCFALGAALSVKYTAVLMFIPLFLIGTHGVLGKRVRPRFDGVALLLLVLPCFPWLFKNLVAFGNPFYPLATGIFGSSMGYSPEMEGALWSDTGRPPEFSIHGVVGVLWGEFFSAANGVNAALAPLILMAFPWFRGSFKGRLGFPFIVFVLSFFGGWAVLCTSLRHGAIGVLVLALGASLAWDRVLRGKGSAPRILFGAGALLSAWLCLATQLNSTAPYASALGLEDGTERLKRNYSVSYDTYAAYRVLEADSDPRDKVMAFGVFQTYPLARNSFVDFFWKDPILLEWASGCRTAEELAERFRREGVTHFLYQRAEALDAHARRGGWRLQGISKKEFVRFWRSFADPVASFENSTVYRIRSVPRDVPVGPLELPGLQEAAGRTPGSATAWGWKARWEAAHGFHREALRSGARAEELGLRTTRNCDIMSMSHSALGQIDQAEHWADLGKKREARWKVLAVEATGHYRSLP